MSDQTPCYAGYCPACKGMVAVTVADVSHSDSMRRALTTRAQWERSGLSIATVTVQAIHEGALTGHSEGCANDKRKKKPARLAL